MEVLAVLQCSDSHRSTDPMSWMKEPISSDTISTLGTDKPICSILRPQQELDILIVLKLRSAYLMMLTKLLTIWMLSCISTTSSSQKDRRTICTCLENLMLESMCQLSLMKLISSISSMPLIPKFTNLNSKDSLSETLLLIGNMMQCQPTWRLDTGEASTTQLHMMQSKHWIVLLNLNSLNLGTRTWLMIANRLLIDSTYLPKTLTFMTLMENATKQ